MKELLVSLGVFIVFHMIPAIAPIRKRLISILGIRAYIVGYSALSIALLVWVGVAYGRADSDILWGQSPWMRWVPVLVMPFVCLLFIGTLSEPNPLSVGVKAKQFDPNHPGIVSITRHPLIWALGLWAAAHMVPNGDEASVLLFGLFAVLAFLGPISLDRKKKQDLGAETWARLSHATSSLPFLAIVLGRVRLDWRGIGMGRIVLALVIYGVIFWFHEAIIGVSPSVF